MPAHAGGWTQLSLAQEQRDQARSRLSMKDMELRALQGQVERLQSELMGLKAAVGQAATTDPGPDLLSMGVLVL